MSFIVTLYPDIFDKHSLDGIVFFFKNTLGWSLFLPGFARRSDTCTEDSEEVVEELEDFEDGHDGEADVKSQDTSNV